MIEGRINLYSDTQTRPSPAMREAMASATVGDEQSFNDPTVNALCDRVAQLLGKEAAVFLPSGTLCNEIALPPGRRDLRPPQRTHHELRRRRPGGHIRRRDSPPRRRARNVFGRGAQ
jgi:hypothetical protein